MKAQADLSRFVRKQRERTGLIQERFAAKFGVTHLSINPCENGRVQTSTPTIRQIQELLRRLGEWGQGLILKNFTGPES